MLYSNFNIKDSQNERRKKHFMHIQPAKNENNNVSERNKRRQSNDAWNDNPKGHETFP